MKNPKTQHVAIKAVGALGDRAGDVVPTLITLLKLKNPNARSDAEQALLSTGTRAREAVPALILLADSDDETAGGAVWTLTYLGAVAAPSIPLLIRKSLSKAQNESALRTREDAIGALGHLGTYNVKIVVPALIRLLDDSSTEIAAANALAKIGPAANHAVPAIKRRLSAAVRCDQGRSLLVTSG
jgi:HEAT repeat protein